MDTAAESLQLWERLTQSISKRLDEVSERERLLAEEQMKSNHEKQLLAEERRTLEQDQRAHKDQTDRDCKRIIERLGELEQADSYLKAKLAEYRAHREQYAQQSATGFHPRPTGAEEKGQQPKAAAGKHKKPESHKERKAGGKSGKPSRAEWEAQKPHSSKGPSQFSNRGAERLQMLLSGERREEARTEYQQRQDRRDEAGLARAVEEARKVIQEKFNIQSSTLPEPATDKME